MKVARSLVLGAALFATSAVAIDLINWLEIPGNARDLFPGVTDVNTNRLGGFFSDLHYDWATNRYFGLGDRGPGGGTIAYQTRVQRFSIDINQTDGSISNFVLRETVPLMQNATVGFNGLSPLFATGNASVLGVSLDPEGFIVSRTGTYYVSDEYEPGVLEFTKTGQLLRRFAIPSRFMPFRNGLLDYNSGTNSGRQDNRGFEGLALSPDGSRLFGMLQDPLADDGNGASGSNLPGRNSRYIRIVAFDTANGSSVAQYAYPLELRTDLNTRAGSNIFGSNDQGRSIGISAIHALSDTRFLVLERDNRGFGVDTSKDSYSKRVFSIDITGATDISNIVLNSTNVGTLTGITTVTKNPTPFLDILQILQSPPYNLGNLVPEKIEGLTVGPRLPNGKFVILLGTDNDVSVTQVAGPQQDACYFRNTTSTPKTFTQVLIPLNGTCPSGSALLPSFLFAFTATEAELGGYTRPQREEPLSISAASTTIVEGSSGRKNLTVTISIAAPVVYPVTVTVSTRDTGSAKSGVDFECLTRTVTIPAGQINVTTDVVILGDIEVEGPETFRVELSNPGQGAVIDPLRSFVTITIQNDDLLDLTLDTFQRVKAKYVNYINLCLTNPSNTAASGATFSLTVPTGINKVMFINMLPTLPIVLPPTTYTFAAVNVAAGATTCMEAKYIALQSNITATFTATVNFNGQTYTRPETVFIRSPF